MSKHVQWQNVKLTEADRVKIKDQQLLCLRMKGVFGSVKPTLANSLLEQINNLGKHDYILDRDDLYHGLNQDFGFIVEPRDLQDEINSLKDELEIKRVSVKQMDLSFDKYISVHKSL